MRRLLASALSTTLAGVALTAAPAAASTTASAATEPSRCAAGHLPAAVDGRSPALRPGAAGGDYLWHDSHGWHLRVTHASHSLAVFTGRISADRVITYAKVADERNDRVRRSADGHTLTVTFHNYGYLDGVDFRTDCAPAVHFSFQVASSHVASHELSPSRVYLGAHRARPLSDPFTVERRH